MLEHDLDESKINYYYYYYIIILDPDNVKLMKCLKQDTTSIIFEQQQHHSDRHDNMIINHSSFPIPRYNKNNKFKCSSNVSQVYIPALNRCLPASQLPYYAHRSAGRAGGGRGGGGGGHGRGSVGGRGTGSRAWFGSDRNMMRKNGDKITNTIDSSIVLLLLLLLLLLL